MLQGWMDGWMTCTFNMYILFNGCWADDNGRLCALAVLVVVLWFYVQGKHLSSCQDGQLT